jgi:hypothetical protein
MRIGAYAFGKVLRSEFLSSQIKPSASGFKFGPSVPEFQCSRLNSRFLGFMLGPSVPDFLSSPFTSS